MPPVWFLLILLIFGVFCLFELRHSAKLRKIEAEKQYSDLVDSFLPKLNFPPRCPGTGEWNPPGITPAFTTLYETRYLLGKAEVIEFVVWSGFDWRYENDMRFPCYFQKREWREMGTVEQKVMA